MGGRVHTYTGPIEWTGNRGTGTASYAAYGCDHEVRHAGKPVLGLSSDAAFRGDPSRFNPEELLVIALASCHMLQYLHLAATHGVTVVAYRDEPTGTMEEDRQGGGAFTQVALRPVVTLVPGSDEGLAAALHEQAHHLCFIARSVTFPVTCRAEIRVAADA